jgi:plasmid stability protein
MPSITISNVPDALHRALRLRAERHGRSTEAEIRDILERATKPEDGLKLGSLLASIARDAGGLTEAEAARFDGLRDRTPAESITFE